MWETDQTIFIPVIRGTFYRAIDPQFRATAISGSRSAGRYSKPTEPTLYLSSSIDGVEAAMIAHKDDRPVVMQILKLHVEANCIFDLRNTSALAALNIDPADAASPWQEEASSGGEPKSWAVRDRLLEAGANGLIDPSRKRPGLWHLVLFCWNEPKAPTVRVLDP